MVRGYLLAFADALDPRTRRGQLLLAAAVVLVTAVTVAAVLLRPDPPAPVAAPDVAVSAPDPGPPSVESPARRGADPAKPFACSRPAATGSSQSPTRICLPDIRVDASIMKLGLNRDRTVEVPPLSRVGDAGWYKYSAAPGAVGPTVVLGHVDSAQYGEGVFFHLSALRKGDTAVVTRADGRTATFVIDRVQQVSKSDFPTDDVYGATSGPALRLVTCGGRYDPSAGRYLDNVIAYGTLRSLQRT